MTYLHIGIYSVP